MQAALSTVPLPKQCPSRSRCVLQPARFPLSGGCLALKPFFSSTSDLLPDLRGVPRRQRTILFHPTTTGNRKERRFLPHLTPVGIHAQTIMKVNGFVLSTTKRILIFSALLCTLLVLASCGSGVLASTPTNQSIHPQIANSQPGAYKFPAWA